MLLPSADDSAAFSSQRFISHLPLALFLPFLFQIAVSFNTEIVIIEGVFVHVEKILFRMQT